MDIVGRRFKLITFGVKWLSNSQWSANFSYEVHMGWFGGWQTLEIAFLFWMYQSYYRLGVVVGWVVLLKNQEVSQQHAKCTSRFFGLCFGSIKFVFGHFSFLEKRPLLCAHWLSTLKIVLDISRKNIYQKSLGLHSNSFVLTWWLDCPL